jgi:hypothetical protein
MQPRSRYPAALYFSIWTRTSPRRTMFDDEIGATAAAFVAAL